MGEKRRKLERESEWMRKVMKEKDGTRTSVCYLLGKHFYCSLEDEDIEGKAVNETETISLLYSYTHAHTHTLTHPHTHAHPCTYTRTHKDFGSNNFHFPQSLRSQKKKPFTANV